MNSQQLIADVEAFVTQASQTYGTGNEVVDVLISATIITFLCLLFALGAYRRAAAPLSLSDMSQIRELLPRHEQLEIQLQELMHYLKVTAEEMHGDLEFIRGEVSEVREILEAQERAQIAARRTEEKRDFSKLINY
jgi:hypothetical protein